MASRNLNIIQKEKHLIRQKILIDMKRIITDQLNPLLGTQRPIIILISNGPVHLSLLYHRTVIFNQPLIQPVNKIVFHGKGSRRNEAIRAGDHNDLFTLQVILKKISNEPIRQMFTELFGYQIITKLKTTV